MKKEESFLTNLTKLYVLISLNNQPKHGYELMVDFEKITGKNLSAGQIYPLLSNMHNKGMLEFREEREGQRKRKIYSLTKDGREFFTDLLVKLGRLMEYGGMQLVPGDTLRIKFGA